MGGLKAPKDYDVEEVCIWLNCIGLGEKIEPFKENAIDGDMLVTLTKEDLTGDLELTNLQAKKFLTKLESTTEMTSGGGGSGGAEKIAALEAEVARLKEENASLKAKLQPAPAPAPAPAPPPAPTRTAAPPPQRRNEHHVIKGAAGGATKGAVKGAIVGAIVPGMDAGDGAKAGAAAGAAGGAMGGVARRRQARRRLR